MATANITRWTPLRKAQLVVNTRRLTRKQVDLLLRQHGVSKEEYERWCQLYDSEGVKALRATKIQNYRDKPSTPAELLLALASTPMSHSQIARRSGVTINTIADIISAKHVPNPSTAEVLMRVLREEQQHV